MKPLIYCLETPSGSPVAWAWETRLMRDLLTGFSPPVENGARSQVIDICEKECMNARRSTRISGNA